MVRKKKSKKKVKSIVAYRANQMSNLYDHFENAAKKLLKKKTNQEHK